MKHFYPITQFPFSKAFIFLFAFQLFAGKLAAQETDNTDKTISPYFYVECPDSTIEHLPLLSTTVNANIVGVIADVTIRQRYKNAGTKAIESKYIFPASTKAAVYNLKMIIGDRTLTAVIKEKEQAQQDYQNAIDQGQTATLLDQERPNVLQMKVGNIMPGDTIDIVLQYTELITPVDGIYEFVYPTVVGPRYFSPSTSDEGDSTWVEIPYTHEGEDPKSNFHIDVSVDGGMPISGISSPSHQSLEINYINADMAECKLPENDSNSGNKDFVLDYVLSGEGCKTGMLLYEETDENYFLSMIQPPTSPESDELNQREYVFILDVSGSMSGFPIETSKTLVKQIIQNLNPQDKFNILCFAGGSNFLFNESQMATSENIDKALNFVGGLQGAGGTELLPALQKALSYPTDNHYSRIFLIATDGYVTVEKQAFDLIRDNLNKANFFTFGIGSSVNRYLIEGMAHAGMGEPFVVLNQDEAATKAELFKKYVATPVLTNIHAGFSGITVSDVEPPAVPDVFAERPILIFGKWENPLQGSLTLKGTTGINTPYSKTLAFGDYVPSEKNKALRYLWARQRIQRMSDYNSVSSEEEYKDSIITLGLKYNLLTQYTSFVAIDSIKRNEGGTTTTVVVPNPMPEGVSDKAIVGSTGSYALTFDVANPSSDVTESKIQSAYPNPFVNQVSLIIYLDKADLYKTKILEIYNDLGEKIKTIDVSQLSHTQNTWLLLPEDVGMISKGIYMVQLRLNDEIAGTCKILKQ